MQLKEHSSTAAGAQLKGNSFTCEMLPKRKQLINRIGIKKALISIVLLCIGIMTTQTELRASANSSHLQLKTAFNAFKQGRYIEAISIWQNLADQGIDSAQINLAAMYDSGKGLPADPGKAANLYRDVASRGDKFAQYNLALMYIEGRGVLQDLLIAETWLQKAAAQKMALAQYQLGLLYSGMYQAASCSDSTLLKSSHLGPMPDINRALRLIYESGLSFEQEADADGLQKTIAAITRLAPGDLRLATLQAKFDTLQNTERSDTNELTLKTSFGTAWPLGNGHVVTNYHVIAGKRELALQNVNGHKIKAWPVVYDQASDLAILAVEDASLLPPALSLCSTDAPLGTSVFTLGFPRVDILGFTPKYTDGIIKSDQGPRGNTDQYLTTVDIQPGNSGGPLLNSNGEVVGVVTAMLAERNETSGELQILSNQSCAVKTANVRQLMKHLPENGQYHHPIAGKDRPSQMLL